MKNRQILVEQPFQSLEFVYLIFILKMYQKKCINWYLTRTICSCTNLFFNIVSQTFCACRAGFTASSVSDINSASHWVQAFQYVHVPVQENQNNVSYIMGSILFFSYAKNVKFAGILFVIIIRKNNWQYEIEYTISSKKWLYIIVSCRLSAKL